MLRLTFVENNPPTELEMDLLRFVNKRIVEILTCTIESFTNCPDYNLSFYFPRGHYEKNPERCKDIIIALRDTIATSFLYEEISPLYSYVLYNILDEWPEICEELPELVRNPLPEDLKMRVYEDLNISYDESDEYEEELFLIEEMENTEYYNMLCFDDTDFLEEDIRGLVECAILGILEPMGLTYEELDQYIEVMPLDVAERYQEFRKKMQNVPIVDIEKVIVVSVQNAMHTFARRIVDHKDKGEVVLTADLQEKIEDILFERYGVSISREFTLGRAAKVIGETDLYFYAKQDGRTLDIAVLENKVIENFKNQYLQLMGYLNPNFKFGMTVSINRNLTIDEAKKKIAKDLKSIQGAFAVIDVYAPKSGENYLMSEHIVPETKKMMRVYHFILNLNDQNRAQAAKDARR